MNMLLLKRNKKDKDDLDEEIARCIEQISKLDLSSEKYAVAAENLKKLFEAKSLRTKWTISPDTILAVGANLVGILLILNYERVGIVTTKALTFLPKGRI